MAILPIMFMSRHAQTPSTPPLHALSRLHSLQEAAAGAAAAGHAVKANIKITNPIKVPCVVNLSVLPRGAEAAGGKGGAGGKGAAPAGGKGGKGGAGGEPVAGYPMEVQPAQLVIPPLEYR